MKTAINHSVTNNWIQGPVQHLAWCLCQPARSVTLGTLHLMLHHRRLKHLSYVKLIKSVSNSRLITALISTARCVMLLLHICAALNFLMHQHRRISLQLMDSVKAITDLPNWRMRKSLGSILAHFALCRRAALKLMFSNWNQIPERPAKVTQNERRCMIMLLQQLQRLLLIVRTIRLMQLLILALINQLPVIIRKL